jgi:hypothetical protein
MRRSDDPFDDNPMNHPAEQPVGADSAPQFGLLFVILGSAVGFIGLAAVTVGSAYT